MFLSDRAIRRYLAEGHLRVEPIEDRQIQPCSIDLRLGPAFLRWPSGSDRSWLVDPKSPPPMELVEVGEGKCFALSPGHLILASTVEQVQLPSTLVGFLEGKSSLARLGLQVHSTGGVIDCGFVGQITLELSVTGPHSLMLWPGMAIAQILFAEETTAVWLAELAKLSREPDRKEIELIITSPGGGAYHAFALYDALRRLAKRGVKVRASVEGIAASAASMIVLQAADERIAAPHARFLLHEARRWVFAAVGRASDLEDEMAEMRALAEQITEILARRCGKTKEEVTAMITRKELWLSAQEALNQGLIDAIVD